MVEPSTCTITFDNENDPSSGSFFFTSETHTMGNAIRQTLIPNESVDFCSYSVPHPAESKMRLRIQAKEGENIIDILDGALNDFSTWCNNTENIFEAAMNEYLSQNM